MAGTEAENKGGVIGTIPKASNSLLSSWYLYDDIFVL